MHVLMPRMGDRGGEHTHPGAHERHFVVLAYDRAYTRPGSAGTESCFDTVGLDGFLIRIGEGLGGSASPDVAKDQVVLLADDVFFSGVDRACVGPNAGDRVTSRVELRAGRVLDFPQNGAVFCLDFPDVCADDTRPKRRRQRMAENVRWVVEGVEGDDGLDLARLVSLTDLGTSARQAASSAPPALPRLFPIDGVVSLRILHVIREALPRDCRFPVLSEAGVRHFGAYYDLATREPRARLQPILIASGPDPSPICSTSQARFA